MYILESPITQVTVRENVAVDNSEGDNGLRNWIRWHTNTFASPTGGGHVYQNKFYDNAKVAPDPAIKYESTGIYVHRSSGLTIEDNEFYQNYSSTVPHDFRGIWQLYSSGNQLIGNEVTGVAGPNTILNITPYRGIYLLESGNTFMSCNSASGLNHGMAFEGPNCDGTDFRYNVMSDNIVGLYLADGTIIGIQYEKENRWPGDLPPGGLFEALYDGPFTPLLSLSTFFINDPNPLSNFWANPRQPLELFQGTDNNPSGIGVVMARAAIDATNYDDAAMCPGYTVPRTRAETPPPAARLMPNPASERCRLVFEQPLTGTLRIISPQGQVVQQALLKETSVFDVETRNLPAGVYQINVQTDRGIQVFNRMNVVH